MHAKPSLSSQDLESHRISSNSEAEDDDDDDDNDDDEDEELDTLAPISLENYKICLFSNVKDSSRYLLSETEAKAKCKANRNQVALFVDASPFEVIGLTPLSKIHMLFNML